MGIETLAVAAGRAPTLVGGIGVIIVLLVYAFIFGLIIVCLVRLVKFLGTAGKETKLMRMEIGKLAEEVHQIKQNLEDNN